MLTLSPCSLSASLRHRCVPVAREPPRGVRALLLSAQFEDAAFRDARRRPIAFALLHFHVALLDRVAFGAVGLSQKYSFSFCDLQIGLRQAGVCQLAALRWYVSELHHGGVVTDPFDRTTLGAMVRHFLRADLATRGCVDGVGPKATVEEFRAYAASYICSNSELKRIFF